LNEAERALDRAVAGDEPFWITFFTARQLATEAMYAAASLGRDDLVRRHATQALESADTMHRRQVLATAVLALSYLPEKGAAPGLASDVVQACEIMRGVLPVIGSLTSARALDAVREVRRRLTGYQLPVVRELELELRQNMTGAGASS